MRAFLPIALVGCASSAASAAMQDTQLWTTASIGTSISGKLQGTLELQVRATDDVSRVGATVIRPSLGWKFSDRVTVSIGFTRNASLAPGKPTVVENNVFQQLNWTVGTIGHVTVKSRTWLEERWLDTGHDTGLRLRERLRFEMPLRKTGPTLALSSEVFFALNSTDWGARAGFDQVRNFVGVNVPLGKGLTIEAGYMNRYQKRTGADRDDHIIPVSLAWRF